jgi:hypothetical protein
MKIIRVFALILVSTFSFAQNDEASIKKDFETIVNFTRQNQIEKILDMTYPRLFEKMPKESVLAMSKMAMDGMGMKMIFEENTINLKMSKTIQLKNAIICLSQYDQNTVIEFNNAMMAKMFLMGQTEDIKIVKIDDKKVKMVGKSYLLAIKDSYTKNTWKYLNYDQNNDSSIMSKEIYDEAVELKAGLKESK